MRMRPVIDVSASLSLACAIVACFTDAPPGEDDTGSSADGDTTSSSTSTSSMSATDITEADAGSGMPDSTSVDPTGDTSSAEIGGNDGSTGATIECGCAVEAMFCEEFESDLAIWEQAVGMPPPQLSDEQAACGVQALKAVMPPNQNTSTLAVDVPGDALLVAPFSLGGFIWIDLGCKSAATIRIARLWFDDGGVVPPEYLVELVIQGDELLLRATGADNARRPVVDSTAVFSTDTWVAFRVDFDMSDPNTPAIAAWIDGAPAITLAGTPALVNLLDPHTFAVLGPRREMGEAGSEDCVVFYDEVWLAPTP